MRIAAAHLGQPQPARHRASKIRISRDTTWAARGQVSHRANGTRRKHNRRDSRPTPDTHGRHAIARLAPDTPSARAPSSERSFLHNASDDPSPTGQQHSTLPSFVYRQEVFELSIVASSIAHAHEEADRKLTISHKHATWAKVDFHNAWRCSTRKRAGNAAIELPGIHSTRTPIRQRSPVSRQQISRSWDKKCRFRGCGARRSRDFEVQTARRAAYPPLRRNYLKVAPLKRHFLSQSCPPRCRRNIAYRNRDGVGWRGRLGNTRQRIRFK